MNLESPPGAQVRLKPQVKAFLRFTDWSLPSWICATSILWFILKAIYLAFHVSPGAPPDEMYHLQVIDLFASSSHLFPFSGSSNPFAPPLAEFARFGNQTELTHLYHRIMGYCVYVLDLDTFEFSTIVFLRLLNLLVSLFTLFYFVKLVDLCRLGESARAFALVIHTNILKFTLLAAAVGYDPATNLCAYVAILALVRFLLEQSRPLLIQLIFFLSVGSIFKFLLVPLAAIMALIVLIILARRTQKNYPLQSVKMSWGNKLYQVIIGTLAALSALALATTLGSLLIRYGTFMPPCTDIFTALECTPVVPPPPVLHEALLPIPLYFFYWLSHMVSSSLGIRSYIGIEPPFPLVILVSSIILISLAYSLARVRRDNWIFRVLIALVIGFSLSVFFLNGYPSYKQFHHYGWGVNGRYLFPILGCLLILSTHCIFAFLTTIKREFYWLPIAAFVILAEFPAFYLSEPGQNFLKPWPEEFYRALSYYPNPIYDSHFQRITN